MKTGRANRISSNGNCADGRGGGARSSRNSVGFGAAGPGIHTQTRRRGTMTKFAIYVELKAKPGRGEEVAAFLASARSLVLNEPETVAWFAVRFDDSTFGIFDAF